MSDPNKKNNDASACGCGGGSCCSGPGKWIWIVLVGAILGIVIAKTAGKKPAAATAPVAVEATGAAVVQMPAGQGTAIPRMVDLGATKCIPCKLMAPILEDLKKTYAGKLEIQFIDVWEKPDEGPKYGIKMIPTQIFFDAAGKELFRHEGFFGKEDILSKWKEFGVDLTGAVATPGVSRWIPARPDARTKEAICYLCDGNIPTNSLVVVKTDKGDVRLCGMHHYFVMYSCLTEDKTGFEKKVTVADWSTGSPISVSDAVYVYGLDAKTDRPTVKAFATKTAAETEQKAAKGDLAGTDSELWLMP